LNFGIGVDVVVTPVIPRVEEYIICDVMYVTSRRRCDRSVSTVSSVSE